MRLLGPWLHEQRLSDLDAITDEVVPLPDLVGRGPVTRGNRREGLAAFHRVIPRATPLVDLNESGAIARAPLLAPLPADRAKGRVFLPDRSAHRLGVGRRTSRVAQDEPRLARCRRPRFVVAHE